MTLATQFRPVRFEQVVGQRPEIEVISAILRQSWRPPALLFAGDFGCGKTTLARLAARALLCEDLQQGAVAPEPCGECGSCRAMDARNHADYVEIDAASHGGVAEVRKIQEELAYRAGSKIRIVCWDECHRLSVAGQDALLAALEEGVERVMFFFCTTEPSKMLSTIRSRCVELPVRLLKTGDILGRLVEVVGVAGIQAEERALKLIATYARGHMRDALVRLEQLSRTADTVTEEVARLYLRLDKRDDVYHLLCEETPRGRRDRLEELLCRMSFRELATEIGEVLSDAHKLSVGVDDFTEADKGWLKRVLGVLGARFVLSAAEKAFFVPDEAPTIQAAVVSLLKVLEPLDTEGPPGVQLGRGPQGTDDGIVPDLSKAPDA